mmetsp:Transcript_13580/g.28059  ORF Transcript_13580/g.28059 Transcript_13580/m.28059 type:complete len:206 (-) Transcript_13580:137-754(-)
MLLFHCHYSIRHNLRDTIERARLLCWRDWLGLSREEYLQFSFGVINDGEKINNDDEDYDPLEDGVDSVAWLPSISTATTTSSSSSSSSSTETSGETEILPFFPPNSEHVLDIFEPRYRQMYTDILMNGSKRLVVSMSHPNQDGTFPTTGVIFHLEDLKEVSELTDDQVKCTCIHKVTNRVKLLNVVSPEEWRTRDTYLKVEDSIL